MSAGRVVGIVVAAILLLFGILWLLAATSSSAENASPGGRFVTGIILLVMGGLLLFVAVRRPKKEEEKELTIVQKIELPGDLRLEEMKCSSCGARLDKDSITVKAGSVMVSCKYCGSQYKLEEEPKW